MTKHIHGNSKKHGVQGKKTLTKGSRGRKTVQSCYKDTVFRMLFRDKQRLLELYNAMSGRHYQDVEALKIVTLENAIYMGMKNDLAFLIDFSLYLYEHQSTVNPNMPLRFLQYAADEYGSLTAEENIYGERQIQLPTPHFAVFYNGTAPLPEKEVLKLSDAYLIRENEPQLELRVPVLNINDGFQEELKEQCRTLKEYMQFVDRVRKYAASISTDVHANGMDTLEAAVDRAVDECIREGILRDFLLSNKAEVKRMSIYEYNEEAARKAIGRTHYERGLAEGEAKGRAEDVIELLEQLEANSGKPVPVPVELQEKIMAQKDLGILKGWLKAAARAESLEEWERQCLKD